MKPRAIDTFFVFSCTATIELWLCHSLLRSVHYSPLCRKLNCKHKPYLKRTINHTV